jgi:integrase
VVLMPRKPTGAVVQRKTKQGVVFALRFTAYGERQYVTLGGEWEGWTLAKAEDELTVTMAQVRQGVWEPPRRESAPAPDVEPTFHEFTSEVWYPAICLEVKDSTAELYLWQLRDFLLPFFKDHRMSEITIREVDRYRDHEVRRQARIRAAWERGDSKRRPSSNETINKTIVRLGQILDLAMEYGYVETNAARGKRRKLKTVKARRNYLDQARQIVALLDAADELDREARAEFRGLGRMALLATPTFSSLRLSELLTLEWDDIDLAGGWINVNKSKTAAGERKTKLRPVLHDILTERKAGVAAPERKGLVFGTTTGKPHSASNVRRMMAAVCERANAKLAAQGEPPLPKITPHSLRHTWCSVMFAIGEPLPNVLADGGWSHPSTPLRIYAHAMRRDPEENACLRVLVEGGVLDHMPSVAKADGRVSR